MRTIRWFVAAGLAVACAACASRRQELENVAKDWCLSIRASQVIPVYPLTEDLQPGDVFIVQKTVHRQVEAYEERGFLSLDQLVTRLDGLDYARFYRDSYWKGDYSGVPHPRPEAAAPASDDDGGRGSSRFPEAEVPRIAFPSYDFQVRRGAGLKLAVPVQGIPMGLSLMGTDEAAGSIAIADAFTYAVDGENLLRRLDAWAGGQIRDELARIAKSADAQLYLRVVSRVYLAGAVTVSLRNRSARGAGLDAGQAKDAGIVDLSKQGAEELRSAAGAYREALAELSQTLNEGAPGGSIRIASATRCSVVLKEDFDRPLVVGYLGFDVPVYEDGRLGPPVPTRDVLEREEVPKPDPAEPGTFLRGVTLAEMSRARFILGLLVRDGDEAAKRHAQSMDKFMDLVPAAYPVPVYGGTADGALDVETDGKTPATPDFRRVTTYMANLNDSAGVLRKFLGAPPEGTAPERLAVLEEDRARTEKELERVRGVLLRSGAVQDAVAYVAALR